MLCVYKSYKNYEFEDWWSEISVNISMKGVNGKEWCGYYVPRFEEEMHRSAGKLPGESKAVEEREAAPKAESAPPAEAPKAEGGGEH